MKSKPLVLQIASERVGILMCLAMRAAKEGSMQLAKRYAMLAKRIAVHYNLHDKQIKNSICKGCKVPLLPDLTAVVVVSSSKRQIIYTCKFCGRESKIKY